MANNEAPLSLKLLNKFASRDGSLRVLAAVMNMQRQAKTASAVSAPAAQPAQEDLSAISAKAREIMNKKASAEEQQAKKVEFIRNKLRALTK